MSGPRRLSAGYAAWASALRRHEWDAIVGDFADLTLYQTWAYGAVRWGEQNLSHLVLERSGRVVAAAQARFFRAPVLGISVAYVRYGPLFRSSATDERLETFRQAVRALRNQFVCAQQMALRLNVNFCSADAPGPYKAVLLEEGFRPAAFVPRLRTLLLDLRPPVEELRGNLLQPWRNQLNQAEKRFGVAVTSGTGTELFEQFTEVYRAMLKSKGFAVFTEVAEFAAMQDLLPPEQKQLIVLGHAEDRVVAGVVLSVTGERAILLLAASNQEGRATRASYAVQWQAVRELKARGCRWYDLGGIDPRSNPGGHRFKQGLAGKSGQDVHYLGQFECCPDVVRATALGVAQAVQTGYRRTRLLLSALRSRRALARTARTDAHRAPEHTTPPLLMETGEQS